MREEGYISARQAAILLWFAVLPTAILFLPSLVILGAGQDAWISLLFSVLLGVGTAIPVYLSSQRFPHHTFPFFNIQR